MTNICKLCKSCDYFEECILKDCICFCNSSDCFVVSCSPCKYYCSREPISIFIYQSEDRYLIQNNNPSEEQK